MVRRSSSDFGSDVDIEFSDDDAGGKKTVPGLGDANTAQIQRPVLQGRLTAMDMPTRPAASAHRPQAAAATPGASGKPPLPRPALPSATVSAASSTVNRPKSSNPAASAAMYRPELRPSNRNVELESLSGSDISDGSLSVDIAVGGGGASSDSLSIEFSEDMPPAQMAAAGAKRVVKPRSSAKSTGGGSEVEIMSLEGKPRMTRVLAPASSLKVAGMRGSTAPTGASTGRDEDVESFSIEFSDMASSMGDISVGSGSGGGKHGPGMSQPATSHTVPARRSTPIHESTSEISFDSLSSGGSIMMSKSRSQHGSAKSSHRSRRTAYSGQSRGFSSSSAPSSSDDGPGFKLGNMDDLLDMLANESIPSGARQGAAGSGISESSRARSKSSYSSDANGSMASSRSRTTVDSDASSGRPRIMAMDALEAATSIASESSSHRRRLQSSSDLSSELSNRSSGRPVIRHAADLEPLSAGHSAEYGSQGEAEAEQDLLAGLTMVKEGGSTSGSSGNDDGSSHASSGANAGLSTWRPHALGRITEADTPRSMTSHPLDTDGSSNSYTSIGSASQVSSTISDAASVSHEQGSQTETETEHAHMALPSVVQTQWEAMPRVEPLSAPASAAPVVAAESAHSGSAGLALRQLRPEYQPAAKMHTDTLTSVPAAVFGVGPRASILPPITHSSLTVDLTPLGFRGHATRTVALQVGSMCEVGTQVAYDPLRRVLIDNPSNPACQLRDAPSQGVTVPNQGVHANASAQLGTAGTTRFKQSNMTASLLAQTQLLGSALGSQQLPLPVGSLQLPGGSWGMLSLAVSNLKAAALLDRVDTASSQLQTIMGIASAGPASTVAAGTAGQLLGRNCMKANAQPLQTGQPNPATLTSVRVDQGAQDAATSETGHAADCPSPFAVSDTVPRTCRAINSREHSSASGSIPEALEVCDLSRDPVGGQPITVSGTTSPSVGCSYESIQGHGHDKAPILRRQVSVSAGGMQSVPHLAHSGSALARAIAPTAAGTSASASLELEHSTLSAHAAGSLGAPRLSTRQSLRTVSRRISSTTGDRHIPEFNQMDVLAKKITVQAGDGQFKLEKEETLSGSPERASPTRNGPANTSPSISAKMLTHLYTPGNGKDVNGGTPETGSAHVQAGGAVDVDIAAAGAGARSTLLRYHDLLAGGHLPAGSLMDPSCVSRLRSELLAAAATAVATCGLGYADAVEELHSASSYKHQLSRLQDDLMRLKHRLGSKASAGETAGMLGASSLGRVVMLDKNSRRLIDVGLEDSLMPPYASPAAPLGGSGTMTGSHRYTTLEETLAFIRAYRPATLSAHS